MSTPLSLDPTVQTGSAPQKQGAPPAGYWTREHALVLVLVVMTAVSISLCLLVARPFLTPLAWAVALAVMAHPVHAWLERRIKKPDLAAGIAVAIVALLIVGPAAFVIHQLGNEAASAIEAFHSGEVTESAKATLEKYPQLGAARQWVQQQLGQGTQQTVQAARSFITGSLGALLELVLTFFFLYFLFRDRRQALKSARSLVPLAEGEADEVFARIGDTIHATVYGTLVVAAVQGALGGLMFWWLGLPAPLLWGVVMGLLAIVPVLGAFIIWVPAAVYLLATGAVAKAIMLAIWGGVVIGLIDNLLYPMLVGKRLRLHTVPVFIAIVGGLAFFGAAGLILGPVILAITQALIDIWRRRTRHGTAEDAVTPPPRIALPEEANPAISAS